MTYKCFEDFLSEKFAKENPQTLDDDWPDAFSDWLADIDVNELLQWADEWGDIRAKEGIDTLAKIMKEKL